MRIKRSQLMEINAQRIQDLEITVQMNDVIEVNSGDSGIRNGGNGGGDDGNVNENIEDENDDLMVDLLIDEARERWNKMRQRRRRR
jgi:hypothetical protein